MGKLRTIYDTEKGLKLNIESKSRFILTDTRSPKHIADTNITGTYYRSKERIPYTMKPLSAHCQHLAGRKSTGGNQGRKKHFELQMSVHENGESGEELKTRRRLL